MRLLLPLLLLPTLAFAQTVTRGPYLQLGTPDSMTIVWRTAEPTPGRVSFGTAPGALVRSVDVASSTQHEVKLTGLKPATRYYYAVGTPGKMLAGGDENHSFVTSPPSGDRRKLRLWVVGDSGTGDLRQAGVRDAMLRATRRDPPDLMIHLGDMAYGEGTDAQFQKRFFDVYQLVLRNTPCWPTMGNHEGITSDSATQTGPYYDAYVLPKAGEAGGVPSGTEAWYSFDFAHVHFVVLDSYESSREPNGPMLDWLKRDLAANQQEWTIAFFHHPPYSKGSHDSDRELQLVEMREKALPILEAGGVDLVLAGHSHVYERSWLIDGAYETPTGGAHVLDDGDGRALSGGAYRKEPGRLPHRGAVYVVAGHGGAPIDPPGVTHPLMYMTEQASGSSLVDIDEDRLTLVNVRADGKSSDRFTLMKSDGFIVVSPDGGESLRAGETFDVRWATEGKASHVRIEFSADGGTTWKEVAATVPNAGSYAWKVPAIATRHGLVRVSDASGAGKRDESDASFVVFDGASDPGDPNHTPTIAPAGVVTQVVGTPLLLGIHAADPDGDALTLSMTGAPQGAVLDGNVFTWLPQPDQAGVHRVVFTANDGRGGTTRDELTLRIADEHGAVPEPLPAAAETSVVQPQGCGVAAAALVLGIGLVTLFVVLRQRGD